MGSNSPITEPDARTIVDLLLRVGRADDISAATALVYALEEQVPAVDLSAAGARAVLGVLDDPPDGLARLRGELMRDR